MSHEEVQKNKDDLATFFEDKMSSLEEYNKLDVISLWELTARYTEIVERQTLKECGKKISPLKHTTIGAFAMALHKEMGDKDLLAKIENPKDYETYSWIRGCLSAGICGHMDGNK